jgi:hypothetical protein
MPIIEKGRRWIGPPYGFLTLLAIFCVIGIGRCLAPYRMPRDAAQVAVDEVLRWVR